MATADFLGVESIGKDQQPLTLADYEVMVALVGETGSGKTSFINALCGYVFKLHSILLEFIANQNSYI